MLLSIAMVSFALAYDGTYHIPDTGEAGDDFLRPRDIHIFASDPGSCGSSCVIAVTNTNGTVKDYQMSFGPLVRFERNISAPMTTTKDSKTHTYTGLAVFSGAGTNEVMHEILLFGDPTWSIPVVCLFPGGNPRPPPPRPPQCQEAHTKDACGSINGSCAWCTSDDKVHALCFDASNVPTSGWSCDKQPNPRPPSCSPMGGFCGGVYPPCCAGMCTGQRPGHSNTCQPTTVEELQSL
jgi:hypothetical protein